MTPSPDLHKAVHMLVDRVDLAHGVQYPFLHHLLAAGALRDAGELAVGLSSGLPGVQGLRGHVAALCADHARRCPPLRA